MYPNENNCKNNFHFKSNEKDKLIKFLNYNPYDFKFSQLQNLFNILSLMLFYGSIIFILIFIFFLRNKKTPLKLIRGVFKIKIILVGKP